MLATLSVCVGVFWWQQGGLRWGAADREGTAPKGSTYLVDLNRATWPELAPLPGIGETLARRIVASRASDGPFASLEELTRVHGIGPKLREAVRPYLMIPDPELPPENTKSRTATLP